MNFLIIKIYPENITPLEAGEEILQKSSAIYGVGWNNERLEVIMIDGQKSVGEVVDHLLHIIQDKITTIEIERIRA